jgi:Beta-lactamase superfamily domain
MTVAVEIEYVTHASLFLRGAKVNLLTDPFYFPELDPLIAPSVRNFPPRDIDAAAFGPLDFVFSSHEHHDHCHPETLARLKPYIGTVLLPAARPALTARYHSVGITNIVYLQNRVPTPLGGGLEVTSYWDDPIDSMLIIKLDGTTILHANDCRGEVATFAEMARQSPVDYAFFCSTSTQELFPLLLGKSADVLEALATVREEAFFAAQLERIAALRPRVVIPYSYTASYVEPGQLHLNGYGRLTPVLFRDRLAAELPDVTCWPLQPGDVIDATTGTVRPIRAENLWGADLSGFRENLAAFARTLEGQLPRFDPGDPADCDAGLRAHLGERLRQGVPHAGLYAILDHAMVLHVSGGADPQSYLVDLRRRSVEPWRRGSGAEPLLEITIPASLVQTLLAGTYDPFMILYTYRVAFTPHARLGRLGPTQEYALYLGVLLTLFMDRENPILAEFAGLEAFLAAAP